MFLTLKPKKYIKYAVCIICIFLICVIVETISNWHNRAISTMTEEMKLTSEIIAVEGEGEGEENCENAPIENVEVLPSPAPEKKFIKWVEFNVCYEALEKAMKLDIKSHSEEIKYNWIEILSYLGTKYGGDFSKYKAKDMDKLTDKLKEGQTIEELSKDMKYYSYYFEAYSAVLQGFLGDYKLETDAEGGNGEKVWKEAYGLKVFSPIAKGYSFSHCDDFGTKRSYGFKRKHLGHDLMGSVGTPVIAIESGTVEALGWNQYGGWRIGIRSFDKKRYYYYAHLRKDHPYQFDLKEGQVVKAGDVIGYLGMTGYSRKENVNNITTPHLHMGMQLIFDESQKECNSEIWIDTYDIVKLLLKNKSAVYKDTEKKESYRKYDFAEPSLESQEVQNTQEN